MNGAMVRRADLAEFLRAKRSVIAPGDVGLAPGERRRTAGLRREEVAQLAGVSVSWYTWLEQGRPINASKDVLDALARALRLDPVERAHLLALAASDRRAGTITQPTVPESLHRLLGALEPNPSYVLGPTWDFLAWNHAYLRLFPVIEILSAAERNLVWIVFADPTARALIVDWEPEARRVLSQFRADTTPIRDDPAVQSLVSRLTLASKEFAAWWPRHDVAGMERRIRVFQHPQAGRIEFEFQQLTPGSEPQLRLITHLSRPGDNSAERLRDAVLLSPR